MYTLCSAMDLVTLRPPTKVFSLSTLMKSPAMALSIILVLIKFQNFKGMFSSAIRKSLPTFKCWDLPALLFSSQFIYFLQPIINKTIEIVKQSGQYHILVIVCDGQVSSEGPTKDAIVKASNYPISIGMGVEIILKITCSNHRCWRWALGSNGRIRRWATCKTIRQLPVRAV